MHTPGRLGMPCVRDESPSFANWSRTALLPTSTWGLQGLNFCSELSHIFFGSITHMLYHSSMWNKITNIYKQHTFQYISYQSVCHQRALCLHSAQACGKSGAPLPDHHARMLRWFSTWVAVTGLLGGRAETLRQDFSALYQHASFVKDCRYKSPPNPLLSIVILKGRPYILGYFNCADTSCRPHSISAICFFAQMHNKAHNVYLYFCVTAAQGPSRTSTSSRVFRRLISVDLCRRPQAECM